MNNQTNNVHSTAYIHITHITGMDERIIKITTARLQFLLCMTQLKLNGNRKKHQHFSFIYNIFFFFRFDNHESESVVTS